MKKKYIVTLAATLLLASTTVLGAEVSTTSEEVTEEVTTETIIENVEVDATIEVITPITTLQEIKISTTTKGEEIVTFAKKFIGTPYVYGGNSLTSGIDCSGFTQQVFRKFNVSLPRTSSAQYKSNGINVQKQDLQPGDLVFYGYDSVCHVAIYIGDNQVIHAPSSGQSVKIAPLWQRGDAPIVGYKRVLS